MHIWRAVKGYFAKHTWQKMRKKIDDLYALRRVNSVPDTAVKKEIALHLDMAAFYQKHRFDPAYPDAELMMIESYRAAATLGHLDALYQLGKHLFERARFWENLDNTCYASKANQKYARDLYEEAHTYLSAAESQGHALAKRLRGMAFIHGWGVNKNREEGFKCIVDSIELENAWDRATHIFEELGLNQPEFFSSIMSLKNRHSS